MNAHRAIVKRPIITEKATLLRQGNIYTFQVDSKANKIQIRQAIEALFEVQMFTNNTDRPLP